MLKTDSIVSARHGCGWRREREVRSISRQQWEYDKLMRQQRPHLHLQQNTNKNTKQNTENKNLPCRWQLASTSSASYLGLSLRLCLWLRIPAAKTKININNAQIYKHKSSGFCCCFFCSSICDPKNRNMPPAVFCEEWKSAEPQKTIGMANACSKYAVCGPGESSGNRQLRLCNPANSIGNLWLNRSQGGYLEETIWTQTFMEWAYYYRGYTRIH